MSNWGKIAVGLRCGKAPDPQFLICWTKQLLGGLRKGDRVLAPVVEMPQHYAAEALMLVFLKTDADSILYVDDDMIYEPADLDVMRDDPEGEKYDILQGLCLSRNPPHNPVIWRQVTDVDENLFYQNAAEPMEHIIEDVVIVGLAFTLIRRDVFMVVRQQIKANEKIFRWNYRGDSEDASFSHLARKAGCTLGVSTKVSIGHRFPMTLRWDFQKGGIAYETHLRNMKIESVLKNG